MMEDPPPISLVDNTVPSDETRTSKPVLKTSSRYLKYSPWSKQRKYAKWQPDKLGVSTDVTKVPSTGESSRQGLSLTESNNTIGEGSNIEYQPSNQDQERPEIYSPDPPHPPPSNRHEEDQQDQQDDAPSQPEQVNEIDILYENQRGLFLCGVPFYSSQSLLQFDPGSWVNRDFKISPVNITNAQVPDPSWQWAWKTWYVDMTGDVDEHGWQYSLYFGSSSWHGTHPWFHSFVRRRRWLRLRVKSPAARNLRDRSGLEKAHMLNDDYFTIHSAAEGRGQSSVGSVSKGTSTYLNEVDEDSESEFEHIEDIPALMAALKSAIVDREKTEFLKRFVEDGGEELYYLNEKIPVIMSYYIFQSSRWQFLVHLTDVMKELSEKASKAKEGKEREAIQRKHDNLSRAAETIRRHITGPQLLDDFRGPMFNLTPVSKQELLAFKNLTHKAIDKREPITGIPEEAEVGREGHIY